MFAAKNELLTRPSGGYTIARSVRLRSSASAYLTRTPGSAGNRRTWTWSGWVKRGTVSPRVSLFGFGTTAGGGQPSGAVYFDSNTIYVVSGGGTSTFVSTTPVYRDPSAWYHIVIAFDSTQATASNRVKIYVNGLQVTALANTTYPSQNYDSDYNNTVAQYIGARAEGGLDAYFDGYMTEINSIDGQALTPSSFGATDAITGVWQPKKYSGTYGTNGFYLNFSSNSTAAALGTDFSGNSNTWTVNNISVTAGATYDSMTDVPTLTSATVANYCVLNPLFAGTASYISGGNLNASISAANTNVLGTFQLPTLGKWYWEYQITTIAGGGAPMGGIATTSANSPAVFYRSSGDKLVDGTGTSYGATYTTTDTIGVAVDVDGGTIAFYKNNTSQGNITYAAAGFYPALRSNAATDVFNINFGQRPFTYTPPSGFVALNTYNLSTPTIPNGAVYMAATLYTGTGAALTVANTVNGTNFQPDWVWVKGRSGATDHALYDVLRGTTKQLESNNTAAETTEATGLTAFGSTGFTVGALAQMNTSAATYVGWQWKANGAGVTNTNGSITSTVSANTTAGFAVVTYTGTGANATVGHGLGVTPSMIIVKSRSQAVNWLVWHTSLPTPSTAYLLLNQTDASSNSPTTVWNSTVPTSSVFSLGTNTSVNNSASTYVAYVFAAVAGYSAFGSYTGNGSADGPFVFLGFRPRFIFIKSSSRVEDWHIMDTSRSTYNKIDADLYPNLSNAEAANNGTDILSNGFKLRSTDSGTNFSGATYIYMAFAENPFKYSLAR